MAFYSRDQKGELIDSQKATTLINVPNQDAFSGFIPSAILELLLRPGSGCVGIRIYNAFNVNNIEKLVVVGVMDDGGEVQQTLNGESGYVLCRIGSNVNIQHVSRDVAKQAALGIVNPGRLGFASYFSVNDIDNLLNTPGCNGIMVHAIKTELPGVPSLHNSHLAIAARHIIDTNGRERIEPTDKQIISLNPCPPNCAANTRAVDDTESFDKYLVPW